MYTEIPCYVTRGDSKERISDEIVCTEVPYYVAVESFSFSKPISDKNGLQPSAANGDVPVRQKHSQWDAEQYTTNQFILYKDNNVKKTMKINKIIHNLTKAFITHICKFKHHQQKIFITPINTRNHNKYEHVLQG